MHLQSLMMMLFILFIVPIVILFTNPNIFFVIIALVLVFISLRNIHTVLFNIYDDQDNEPDEELIEDLELSLNIDMRKFGKGIRVVIDLIFILFFVYSVFFINSVWIKALFGIIIFYWCTDIILILGKRHKITEILLATRRVSTIIVLTNSITIILITIAICNKFLMGKI
jgi:hypothetical protein